MKRVIHIEQNTENIILTVENVGVKEIGIMVGDALLAVCDDDRLLGDNSSEDAKNVLMNIILAKLGYGVDDENECD